MQNPKSSKFDTKVIHGTPPEPELRDIIPAIHPATIYKHPDSGMDFNSDFYSRIDNPNRRQLELLCCELESGAAAAAFSSGMAAIGSVFQALSPGEHILLPRDVYHGTRTLMQNLMSRWNLLYNEVDMTDPDTVAQAIRPETRLIWIESPSNPMLHITDISAICELANRQSHRIHVAVDNTWPSPALQQPLQLGADFAVHSATKYLGGHSDILGGVVISKEHDELFQRVREVQQQYGAVLSPNDCWLLVRSIKTLAWRMKGHCRNAAALADFLNGRKEVQQVHYPGLSDHPGHKVAGRQMHDFGGMISFEIDGDDEAALRVVAQSQIISRATSLGGVESLWEHRLSSESANSQTPPSLIRLSVGLEDPEDLQQDIATALSYA